MVEALVASLVAVALVASWVAVVVISPVPTIVVALVAAEMLLGISVGLLDVLSSLVSAVAWSICQVIKECYLLAKILVGQFDYHIVGIVACQIAAPVVVDVACALKHGVFQGRLLCLHGTGGMRLKLEVLWTLGAEVHLIELAACVADLVEIDDDGVASDCLRLWWT